MTGSSRTAAPAFAGTPRDIFFGDTTAGQRRLFYLALAAAVLAGSSWLGSRGDIAFPLDDAYITLHNARVLLSGSDPNFPGTPALAGSTSSVHLLLVAALGTCMPLAAAAFVAGAGAALLYVLGLARLAFALGGSRLLAAHAVALGVLSGYAPYHLLNGLETGLAMAAATWALVFALGAPSWRLPLLCGLLPFIRPELGMLAFLLLGRQAWLRVAQPHSVTLAMRDAMVAAAAALPWLLWTAWDTGGLFPATIAAKAAWFAEAGLPIAVKLLAVLGALRLMTVVGAGLGFVVTPRDSLGIAVLAFVGVFVAAYCLRLPGALHHNAHRYLQVLLPLSVFSMVAAARTRRLARGIVVASTLLLAVTLPHALGLYADARRHTERELAGVAQWTRANLPANARILIHDAGYLSFATRFELVDMVGLKTPSSIAFHRRLTAPSNGASRGQAVHEIALHARPTHAVILDDDFWGEAAGYLKQHGWVLEPLRPAPRAGDYAVFRLVPPGRRQQPRTVTAEAP